MRRFQYESAALASETSGQDGTFHRSLKAAPTSAMPDIDQPLRRGRHLWRDRSEWWSILYRLAFRIFCFPARFYRQLIRAMSRDWLCETTIQLRPRAVDLMMFQRTRNRQFITNDLNGDPSIHHHRTRAVAKR
jgi:hypothetical protein